MLISNPLEEAEWLFPVAECFHILGFALSIGTIAIVDVTMLSQSAVGGDAARLDRDLMPWTVAGIADMLFSGLLLFLGNGGIHEYWYKDPFRFKLACLTVALFFHYTLHRRAVAGGLTLSLTRAVAGISLLLWLAVLTGGIFIGFAIGG
jgi:hypothetical protein